MKQLFLMPGEERCERFKDGNGIPRVHYSYRSMHGAFFDCESRSLEEAQRREAEVFAFYRFISTVERRQVPAHCPRCSGPYPK